MRPLKSTIAALLLASGVLASSDTFAGSAATAERASPSTAFGGSVDSTESVGRASWRNFDRFLERYEAANEAFINGDPTRWLAMITENDPASIFGGFGGLGEAGVADVYQRYVLAARAFRPSGAELDVEYRVKDVQRRIAYTVAIERAEVLYPGHTELAPHILRVTMIFRFERGDWKIVHRHADSMIDLQLPS